MFNSCTAVHRLGTLSVHQDVGWQQRIGSSVRKAPSGLDRHGAAGAYSSALRGLRVAHVTADAVPRASGELNRISLWNGVFVSRACLPIRRSGLRTDGRFDSLLAVAFSHCPKQHSLARRHGRRDRARCRVGQTSLTEWRRGNGRTRFRVRPICTLELRRNWRHRLARSQ